MKDSHTFIKTPYKIDRQLSQQLNLSDDIDKTLQEIDQRDRQITHDNEITCQSAQKQIMKNVQFKRRKDQGFLSGMLAKLSPIDSETPSAPVLENFEDYAPVDTPVNVPRNRGTVHLSRQPQETLHAANECTTLSQFSFDSERRSPWFEKQGKDDLNNFFDTHKKNQLFDQVQRQPVQCPGAWEEQTKNLMKINEI